MLKHVFILSGIPGSGKSTLCQRIRNVLKDARPNIFFTKFSADDYFTSSGQYIFDPCYIGEAHQNCFRNFIVAAMLDYIDVICVDNTNLSAHEISPYYLAAETFGYGVTILRVEAPVQECFARQTHNVPQSAFARMEKNFADRNVLPYWNVVPLGNETEMDIFIRSVYERAK